MLLISLPQVDFIVGREIEIGGTYKGVVTSIKEYGAFVEFNGGQQGLLHISELSHDPVCRFCENLDNLGCPFIISSSTICALFAYLLFFLI